MTVRNCYLQRFVNALNDIKIFGVSRVKRANIKKYFICFQIVGIYITEEIQYRTCLDMVTDFMEISTDFWCWKTHGRRVINVIILCVTVRYSKSFYHHFLLPRRYQQKVLNLVRYMGGQILSFLLLNSFLLGKKILHFHSRGLFFFFHNRP